MITENTILKPDPEVIFASLPNEEVVLLHLGAGKYFSLNETGSYIWQLINEGYLLKDMSNKLIKKYDVTSERAQICVLDLITELVNENLVYPIND